MGPASLDAVIVYGNAWQNDYLRYATDFGILEDQALAIAHAGGEAVLISTVRWKPSVRQWKCSGVVELVHAPDLMGTVDDALSRSRPLRNAVVS
jgi:Xaa-Pro dipeptidase